MRVLIIGSGGREHALSWKVARSGKAEKIYCAPGNGGTAQEGENIPLKDSDVAGLVSFAKGNVIDFVGYYKKYSKDCQSLSSKSFWRT